MSKRKVRVVSPSDKVFVGRPPFGYMKNGERWVVDPWAASRIEFALHAFSEGKKPVAIINGMSTKFRYQRDNKTKRNWHFSELWSIARYAKLYCSGEYESPKVGRICCPDLSFVDPVCLNVLDTMKAKDAKARRIKAHRQRRQRILAKTQKQEQRIQAKTQKQEQSDVGQ